MWKGIAICILTLACTGVSVHLIPALSTHIGPTVITGTMIVALTFGVFWFLALKK